MTHFDRIAVVDWSASSAPPKTSPQADAIWIGQASARGVVTTYHPSRHLAEQAIVASIAQTRAAWESLLIGVDFALGYPAGFAPRLTGQAQASAVWRWLEEQITDSPANLNNRFIVADAINRQFGGQGPFWGHPNGQSFAHLSPRKRVDYAALGLAERRQVEFLLPRAQPVWKLFTTGAVGGQSLMGQPMIHRLATQHGASVWPFDAPSAVTVAEVYPSLLARAVTAALGTASIKDEVQVRLLAQALWRVGQSGDLAGMLAEAPAAVRAEEGWILGATAAGTLLAAL
jgi:molybdopterin-guanine dinucleotide biosynthesis protein B